jgi:dihydroxyacetone kinase-like predicted kinase
MDEQYKEMREQILSQHSDEISLIVITEGKGIEGFLKDNTYGSLKIVKTSDFFKMPLEEFADKVSDISSKSKIIVSNNEEDYQKILNFYGHSNDDVIIIGTKNDAELVSAILSFSPEQDVEGNIFSMKDAVSSTTSIVIHPSQLKDKNALINFLVKESGLEMSNTFISLFLSESLDVDQIAHLNELLLEDLGVAEVETITCDSKKWDILISVE